MTKLPLLSEKIQYKAKLHIFECSPKLPNTNPKSYNKSYLTPCYRDTAQTQIMYGLSYNKQSISPTLFD